MTYARHSEERDQGTEIDVSRYEEYFNGKIPSGGSKVGARLPRKPLIGQRIVLFYPMPTLDVTPR